MSDEKCKNCGFPVSPQIVIGGTPGPQGPKGDTPDMSEYAKKTEIPIKVSDLDNDSDFVSRSVADLENYYVKTQTYTREEINQKIGAIKTASFEVVDTLPASGEENIIYLVPKVGGEVPDTHDEYIWVDGAWELIGSTQIDLSNYLQKTGDASDTTVTFVSETGEPTSGSSLSSIVGRIVKKISDIVSGAIQVAKATSATKATQDGDGNNISSTYLKRSGGTMTGNLGLSNEGHVNGAVGNLIGRFTWAGGLKAVVGNAQDTLALLSKDAATLNGSPIITGKGGLVSGLITGSNLCYTHHNVAGLSSTQHTGWIDIDFGTRQAMYTGSIRMYMYGKGVIDLLFEGYLYDQGSGQYVWASPAFGFSGSLSSALPQVRFVRDGDGGGHILLGGDGYTWGLQSSVVIREITLGNSAYNGANPLSITITKSTGDFSTLGMTDAVINPIGTVPSQGIEVERARKDGDGNKISETYLKRSGGTMTGTLVQKKGNCSIHTDVASYRIPSQHKGWIALDCGINNAISIVGHITLYGYYAGALSIQVSGYTYAEGIALTRDNWITPRYGIYGSWYGDMPQVAFVKDGTTGRRYIIIGGDDFTWNAYDYVSLDKVVLGSLGNTTSALPFTWSALSGTVASLGLVAATAGDMSEGVEVQRARQDKDGNDIPSTYATKEELPDVYVDTVPSNPKDGDILITTTD
jgi:hypothetical protein